MILISLRIYRKLLFIPRLFCALVVSRKLMIINNTFLYHDYRTVLAYTYNQFPTMHYVVDTLI